MKGYNRIIIAVALFWIFLIVGSVFFINNISTREDNSCKVWQNRVERSLLLYEEQYNTYAKSLEELKTYTGDEYMFITGLLPVKETEDIYDITSKNNYSNEDYIIFNSGRYTYVIYYRHDYLTGKKVALYMVILLLIGMLVTFIVLLYVGKRIIKPFNKMTQLPYELAKGNITTPLREESKNRYFGSYIWGMELMREKLLENKEKELKLLRDKKLLILALSHDIKTPLSAIKLYGNALSRHLYTSEEKKQAVAEGIISKTNEIEDYIAKMVQASNEDFLSFDVNNSEFYIENALTKINDYYLEKMELSQIEFSIMPYNNIIVYGDMDRFVEVMQNIIENAIKYGDGKRIWIDNSRDEDMVVISIHNTGCTLDTKELTHIFDSFFRGSNVNNNPGSGLGLYICRNLMHLMNGEIFAQINDNAEMCVNLYLKMM